MSFVNYGTKEIISKIIYCGPSLSGKTANLKYISENTKEHSKGTFISLNTEAERTLFFDFLPLDLGKMNNFQIRLHLYSVPGHLFYESSRRLLLKGVDGIVFVADSKRNRVEANVESIKELVKHLKQFDLSLSELPFVMQFNKRDLPSALPLSELSQTLNRFNVPELEAVAVEGRGVFDSLKQVSKLVMANLKSEIRSSGQHEGQDTV